MAQIFGNRYQTEFLPPSIEEYVAPDDPVRAYDAFVETLDLGIIGIKNEQVKVGNPQFNPKSMIKLIIYGCSYGGTRSSRKLERACYHNISFIWLMEGLKPDYRTIARFIKGNKEPLKNVFKQCAKLCIELKLIEGNTLFVDGSKIRANASINNTWTKEKCDKYLINIDERIESILKDCAEADTKEQNNPSLVKLGEELKNKQALKSRVKSIMSKIQDETKDSVNSTDPDCVKIKGRQGTHSGYNGQIVVDEKYGLIVSNDVVNENSDSHQFANQIEQANEVMGKDCENACADSGYATTEELQKIDEQNINVIVPSQKQAAHDKEPKRFSKDQFKYNNEKDSYICPEGHEMPLNYISSEKQEKLYSFKNPSICCNCKFYGICTKAKQGRTITRLCNEETRVKFEKQYATEPSQKIYKLRKQKVELPFGHIKHNLGVSGFLLRGIEGVRAEMAVLSTCFNIARMITIFGVSGLITKLMGV